MASNWREMTISELELASQYRLYSDYAVFFLRGSLDIIPHGAQISQYDNMSWLGLHGGYVSHAWLL
jgi:hypothetical protein